MSADGTKPTNALPSAFSAMRETRDSVSCWRASTRLLTTPSSSTTAAAPKKRWPLAARLFTSFTDANIPFASLHAASDAAVSRLCWRPTSDKSSASRFFSCLRRPLKYASISSEVVNAESSMVFTRASSWATISCSCRVISPSTWLFSSAFFRRSLAGVTSSALRATRSCLECPNGTHLEQIGLRHTVQYRSTTSPWTWQRARPSSCLPRSDTPTSTWCLVRFVRLWLETWNSHSSCPHVWQWITAGLASSSSHSLHATSPPSSLAASTWWHDKDATLIVTIVGCWHETHTTVACSFTRPITHRQHAACKQSRTLASSGGWPQNTQRKDSSLLPSSLTAEASAIVDSNY